MGSPRAGMDSVPLGFPVRERNDRSLAREHRLLSSLPPCRLRWPAALVWRTNQRPQGRGRTPRKRLAMRPRGAGWPCGGGEVRLAACPRRRRSLKSPQSARYSRCLLHRHMPATGKRPVAGSMWDGIVRYAEPARPEAQKRPQCEASCALAADEVQQCSASCASTAGQVRQCAASCCLATGAS